MPMTRRARIIHTRGSGECRALQLQRLCGGTHTTHTRRGEYKSFWQSGEKERKKNRHNLSDMRRSHRPPAPPSASPSSSINPMGDARARDPASALRAAYHAQAAHALRLGVPLSALPKPPPPDADVEAVQVVRRELEGLLASFLSAGL